MTTTPARRPAMTEKQLLAAIVDLARLLRFEVYHTWLSARSTPGFPDVLLARLGADGRTHLVVAELKSDTGRLTAEQAHWLNLFAGAGIAAYVWRPIDWHSGAIEQVLTAASRA